MAFKRIATEGATTDGRKISRAWIEQIANNYDPEKYGARLWNEHMRGMLADGPFPALGDVKAVKAQQNNAGQLELYADIDPTDQLKAINSRRQKVYTSIEVDPDFAGSGEAYLVGLAVTDSPASLGTEMLQFSQQQGDNSPLAGRKQNPHNVFTASTQLDTDFTTDDAPHGEPGQPSPTPDEHTSLRDKLTAIFRRQDKKAADGDTALRTEVEDSLALFAEQHGALAEQVKQRPSADEFAALKTKVDAIYTALDNTPDIPPRTPATGNEGGAAQADC